MSGWLAWSVKRSLQAYVRSSEGEIEVGEGAVLEGDEILFPATDAAVGVDGYRGFVRFHAHDGMLDWFLGSPRIEQDGRLTVARRDGSRFVLATIHGDAVLLAPEGALVFEGFYPVGTVLDPLRVVAE